MPHFALIAALLVLSAPFGQPQTAALAQQASRSMVLAFDDEIGRDWDDDGSEDEPNAWNDDQDDDASPGDDDDDSAHGLDDDDGDDDAFEPTVRA